MPVTDRFRLVLATFALGATTALPAQRIPRVLTVDDDGPAAFPSIQAAVDAATNRDVVLVRDGSYAEFVLDGKGVAVVADVGANVLVLGTPGSLATVVRDVPAGERALIRGLRFDPPDTIDEDVVQIENCQGVVWLEEVEFEPTLGLPFVHRLSAGQTMSIRDSDHVVLVRSTIPGQPGAFPGFGLEAGAIGLRSMRSTVFVHDCGFTGGSTIVQSGNGRPAILIEAGLLVLRDSRLFGAQGGPSAPFGLPGPGDGGPAIRVESGADVWSIGSELVGGPGGSRPIGGGNGNPGPPFQLVRGTLTEDPAEAATLTTTRVVRDDDPVSDEVVLDLVSVPNSMVVLLANFRSDPVFLSALPEFLGVGEQPLIVPFGTTDASGALSQAIGIPTLVPGQETWDATVQLGVLTPSLGVEVSNPSIFVVVDERF